jgi:uncharacterized Zn finger protein
MPAKAPFIIACPVCGSSREQLHRDHRASLVYSCMTCCHEWQIDPADEPAERDLTVVAERRRTPRTLKRPRLRKP